MTNEEALTTGHTLEDENAHNVLAQLEEDPIKFWTGIAEAYARQGNYDQAYAILEGIVKESE